MRAQCAHIPERLNLYLGRERYSVKTGHQIRELKDYLGAGEVGGALGKWGTRSVLSTKNGICAKVQGRGGVGLGQPGENSGNSLS